MTNQPQKKQHVDDEQNRTLGFEHVVRVLSKGNEASGIFPGWGPRVRR